MSSSAININIEEIKSLAGSHLLVGVTGHRDLLPEDYALERNSNKKLNAAIREVFAEIQQQYPRRKIVLLNCMAEGADALAAVVAGEMGIPVLPVTAKDAAKEATETDLFYVQTAEIIAGYSNILIALWDGVDTGLVGGTSDIVQMMIEGKNSNGQKHVYHQKKKTAFDSAKISRLHKQEIDPKGIIYHILTRRKVNPYPINRFENNTGLPVAEGTTKTSFPLHLPYRKPGNGLWQSIKKNIWYNNLVGTFLMPIALALMTITLGTYGFRHLRISEAVKAGEAVQKNVIGDDFFGAINLITFDSSVLEAEEIHWTLSVARILGLITVVFGFSMALAAALGNNFKTELGLLWMRLLRLVKIRRKYNLVIGMDTVGFNLAMDIRKKGELVVILDTNINDTFKAEALRSGINLFKGSPYSAAVLKRLRVTQADEIFIVTSSDTDNIRVLQELDQLCCIKKDKQSYKWFIHLQDQRLKDAVRNADRLTQNAEMVIVNIYENIARRLLIKYPADCFQQNKKDQLAEILVFGNTEVATQIVMQCIRQARYNNGNRLRVTWFVKDKESFSNDFYKKYPCLLFGEDNQVFNRQYAKEIRDRVFREDILQFREVPVSDTAFFDNGIIYNAIKSGSVIRLYFCFEDSIVSAAYMNTIARKIKLERFDGSEPKAVNLQLFCFYNIPDKDEVRHVELISNRNVPYIPIIFFGNFTDECTWKAFAEKSLDELPMLINLWYSIKHLVQDGKEEERASVMQQAKEKWKGISENFKESSRQAADHLWVKMRMLGVPVNVLQQSRFETGNPEFTQQINELAMVEHYRWCGERLLEGYIPVQDIEERAVTEPGWYIENWHRPAFKRFYQDQKLHIDLVVFEKLFSGYYNERYYNEKGKDISFIEAIPFFLKWAGSSG